LYALWSVLLGAHHPLVTNYRAFLDQHIKREKFLETVEPFDPGHKQLAPALAWLRLRTNLWVQAQAKSVGHVLPHDFTLRFDQMTLLERWEQKFPTRYLETPVVKDARPSAPNPKADTMLPAPAYPTPTPDTIQGLSRKSTTVRSDTYTSAFQKFKAVGIRPRPSETI